MKGKNIFVVALLQAIAVASYIAMVVSFLTNAQFFLGELEGGILGGMLFLLTFVISVAMMGLLIFGQAIMWYLDGAKAEAVHLVLGTVGFLILLASGLVVFFLVV